MLAPSCVAFVVRGLQDRDQRLRHTPVLQTALSGLRLGSEPLDTHTGEQTAIPFLLTPVRRAMGDQNHFIARARRKVQRNIQKTTI